MVVEDFLVLIVDDSRIMRRIVVQKLAAMGIVNIVEADNGQDALRLAEQQPVALIISDWSMPVMTGMDLLTAVRGHDRLAVIPFVLLTAEAQLDNILMAYRQQVDEYIVKPFTNEYFEYTVGKVALQYNLFLAGRREG